ncbi:MAG: hypothetical protein IKG93_09765 [Clostridiales bacterium]|nr:hypothetical protein [Clostridiales bacterium]
MKNNVNSRGSWTTFCACLIAIGSALAFFSVFLFFCQKGEEKAILPFVIMGIVAVLFFAAGILVYRMDRKQTRRFKKVDKKKDYRITLLYKGKAEKNPDIDRMRQVINECYETRGFYQLLCYPDMGDVSEIRGFFNHITDHFETNAYIVSKTGLELWFGYSNPSINTDMLMCSAIIEKKPMDFKNVVIKSERQQLSEMKSAIDLLYLKYTITDSAIAIIKDGVFYNNKLALGGKDDYIAIIRQKVKEKTITYYDAMGNKQEITPANSEEFIKEHFTPKPVEE